MFLNIAFIHWLVVLSIAINLWGSIAYIRDIIKGDTKPNLVSWSLWALAPMIATAAAVYAGADFWVTTRTFLAGFTPLLVVIFACAHPRSYWKLTRFDFICGALSLVAIVVWITIDAPRLAILLVVIADGLAILPTVRKAWSNPETETGLVFIAGIIATLLVIPSIPVWNIENAAFQVYLLVANSILIFSIYRKRILSGLFYKT